MTSAPALRVPAAGAQIPSQSMCFFKCCPRIEIRLTYCFCVWQGRATSSLHFSHYAPVPNAVQEEIVAKVKGTAK